MIVMMVLTKMKTELEVEVITSIKCIAWRFWTEWAFAGVRRMTGKSGMFSSLAYSYGGNMWY